MKAESGDQEHEQEQEQEAGMTQVIMGIADERRKGLDTESGARGEKKNLGAVRSG